MDTANTRKVSIYVPDLDLSVSWGSVIWQHIECDFHLIVENFWLGGGLLIISYFNSVIICVQIASLLCNWKSFNIWFHSAIQMVTNYLHKAQSMLCWLCIRCHTVDTIWKCDGRDNRKPLNTMHCCSVKSTGTSIGLKTNENGLAVFKVEIMENSIFSG